MTERLTLLLREEAQAAHIPGAPIAGIVSRGRRLRRRRTTGVAVLIGSAACALALVTGVAVNRGPEGPVLIPDPAASAPLDATGWAVAAGKTVFLGNGAHATVPSAIKSLYYTSAGVVVRTGRSAYSDGSPDSSYALVSSDGDVTSLGLSLGDRVPSTDPTLPYLAYAENDGGGHDSWRLILRDVTSGDKVASIPFRGDFTWGGWIAPPVALDRDTVYVGLDDHTLAIDWRTGESKIAPGLPASTMPTVTAGRDAVGGWDEQTVVRDAATGEALTTLAAREGGTSLSPDGRWALQVPVSNCVDNGPCTFDTSESSVVDVTTGQTMAAHVGDQAGWTPGDRIIVVEDREVSLCEPATGACTPTGITLGTGIIRVGGNSYES